MNCLLASICPIHLIGWISLYKDQRKISPRLVSKLSSLLFFLNEAAVKTWPTNYIERKRGRRLCGPSICLICLPTQLLMCGLAQFRSDNGQIYQSRQIVLFHPSTAAAASTISGSFINNKVCLLIFSYPRNNRRKLECPDVGSNCALETLFFLFNTLLCYIYKTVLKHNLIFCTVFLLK